MTDDRLPFDDPDLKDILARRAFMQLNYLKQIFLDFQIKIDDSRTDAWLPYFQTIAGEEVFTVFEAEAKRYEKKYNRKDKSREPIGWPLSQYARDIDEARTGKERVIIRLVQWDRAWIFVDWVKSRILDAQEKGNSKFLRNIGEAISKEPGCKVGCTATGGKLILLLSKAVVVYWRTHYPGKEIREGLKCLHDQLYSKWYEKHKRESPEIALFNDRDYFFKFLKNHGVIRADTKK